MLRRQRAMNASTRFISRHSKALKNKITDKASTAMAAPMVAYHNAKSRGATKDYNSILDYRAKNKRGIATKREGAIYQGIKNKYGSK